MKQLLISLVSVTLFFFTIMSANAQSICTDFENQPINNVGISAISGTGWKMYNWPSGGGSASSPPQIKIQATIGYNNIATKVITASDIQGSTHLINDLDFKGDWTKKDTCFCFDLKLITDGDNTQVLGPFAHGINIYQNLTTAPFSNTNPGKRFQFVLSSSYDENTPWRHICLPIHKIALGATTLPGNNDGHWIPAPPTTVSDWNSVITNVSAVGFLVDVTKANQDEVIGLDNICLGCDSIQHNEPKDSLCCPGKNLVINGGFNATTGFSSNYSFQPIVALSSILPGSFGVLNQSQAAIVSPNTWLLKDHGTCSGLGKFLIINGKTGQTGGPTTVWEQLIPFPLVVKDTEYVFCAYFKNLPQCAFDVKPIITVFINNQPFTNPITINTSATLLCDWQLVSFKFIAPTNGVTIAIKLDETSLGDGNDLAIDDISVINAAPNSKNLAEFQITTQDIVNPNDNFYQIIAKPDNNNSKPLSPDCKYAWLACETDPNNLPTCYNGTLMFGGTLISSVYATNSWNYISNDFPGYCCTNNVTVPQGNFEYKKFYRLSLVVNCPCNERMQWTDIISVQGRQAKATITRQPNFRLTDADINELQKGK